MIALDFLAEFIINDILNMTDEEIIQEAIDDGDDIKQIANDTLMMFKRAIINTKAKND